MDLIIAVIATDHQSSSCPNLSYSEVRGPVSSVYPIGSPYAMPLMPQTLFRQIGIPSFSPQPSSSLDVLTRLLVNSVGAPSDPLNAALSNAQASTAQSLAAVAAMNSFIQMGGGLDGSACPTSSANQVATAFPTPSHQHNLTSHLGSFGTNPTLLPGQFFPQKFI